jgi:hypothetical protein
MAYKISLPLPPVWHSKIETLEEAEGEKILHLEAHLPNNEEEKDDAIIDVYVGDMPEGTTAQDEALANYADMVGFEEDDEDEDPITEWPFNKKKAYGFEAYCEDDSPIRVMCVEIRPKVLCIINTVACTDEKLVEIVQYVERKLKVDKENVEEK